MPDAEFRPFDSEELASWLARSTDRYVRERQAAGDTEAEATANARSTMERLFPGGAPAPGQQLGWVLVDGKPVGELWVGPFGDDPTRWWIWDVAVREELRGRGFGRAAAVLAERLCREHGATDLGLNVFARNGVARALYSSLGYEETSLQLRKHLG